MFFVFFTKNPNLQKKFFLLRIQIEHKKNVCVCVCVWGGGGGGGLEYVIFLL